MQRICHPSAVLAVRERVFPSLDCEVLYQISLAPLIPLTGRSMGR